MSTHEKLRRLIRDKASKATLSAISVTAVLAGFLSAAGIRWPLLAYLAIILVLSPIVLTLLGFAVGPFGYLMLLPGLRSRGRGSQTPEPLGLMTPAPSVRASLVQATRSDDPIYSAGLKTLLGQSHPIIIVPSNPRDVSKPHELLHPLFTDGKSRSRVELDLRPEGFRLPTLRFERELPEGVQDADHTLAIKDQLFIPELVLALRDAGAQLGNPVMWPEHCVDAQLIAERDVIIIGGPDTNFWHAALFEAIAHEFEHPRSSVPLALSLRDQSHEIPIYGSRSLLLQLASPAGLPNRTDLELDERIFPTYAMILATRNPLAAARGLSRWCVFVAGSRSLGTSGAVIALSAMLRIMVEDSQANFASTVPTSVPGIHAQASAILCRTTEVECAMIRRGGQTLNRARQRLSPVGLDPHYSDTYVPTEVEYLSYTGTASKWDTLCRIPD